MLYLHPESLSPDPLYGAKSKSGNEVVQPVYPHSLVRAQPSPTSLKQWAANLDLFKNPAQVSLTPDSAGQVCLVLDFGTELNGALEVEFSAPKAGVLFAAFGESAEEAEEWGLPTRSPWHLSNKEEFRFEAGENQHTFVERGFRFVKLHFFDCGGPIELKLIAVRARFTFTKREGDFLCSDKRFQRVWQSSVYTARLCTQPDDVWDGIKRDRHGWYGDVRISKETADLVFFNSKPAEALMGRLPVDTWCNGIPNFSLDCVSMLKQHILYYGSDLKTVESIYQRVQTMLDWALRTQTNPQGLLIRDPKQDYFYGIGFCDWSPLPDGGRFEELGWLQCCFAEALRDGAIIAGWLDRSADRRRFSEAYETLSKTIRREFWTPGSGFDHSLNISESCPWHKEKYDGKHHRETYLEEKRLGRSGPSRHANARAVLAGLCDDEQKKIALEHVFQSQTIPPIITTYYKFYEQTARAACGDAAGALLHMREFLGGMLEENDAATIWEWYEPEVTGLRKLDLGMNLLDPVKTSIPKSLCHGWGSGTVALTTRYLLGIEPVAPGYSKVLQRKPADLPWTFEASIPTPHGPIHIEKTEADGEINYHWPKEIEIVTKNAEQSA